MEPVCRGDHVTHRTANLPVHVLVDHREAAARTVAVLRGVEGLTFEFDCLPVGDYQVDRTFVVERKTLSDFAVSVQDGRLFRQAAALANLPASMRGVLILEGTSADRSGNGMRREALQGALITITLSYGVPVLRSMDAEESVRLMLYAARQARTFATRALPRHARRPKGKRKAQIELLQGIPGVGPDRAERLLERFGSVEAVLSAPLEKLDSVAGIGERTAANIRWLACEPSQPDYGSKDANL